MICTVRPIFCYFLTLVYNRSGVIVDFVVQPVEPTSPVQFLKHCWTVIVFILSLQLWFGKLLLGCEVHVAAPERAEKYQALLNILSLLWKQVVPDGVNKICCRTEYRADIFYCIFQIPNRMTSCNFVDIIVSFFFGKLYILYLIMLFLFA